MGNVNHPSLVLLHGHAGSPITFDGLSARTGAHAVSCPISPTFGDVRSWWKPEEFGPTADTLSQVMLPGGPVVLGGFSQGAAMATAVATAPTTATVTATAAEELVGLIFVAGFLPDPAPVLQRSLPTLCLHSEDDATVDPFLGARLRKWAQAAGGLITYAEYDGGHVWNDEVDELVAGWFLRLAESLDSRAINNEAVNNEAFKNAAFKNEAFDA